MTINIDDYGKFVRSTTSDESLRTEVMADRLFGLQNTYSDAEWSQLITCSMGTVSYTHLTLPTNREV